MMMETVLSRSMRLMFTGSAAVVGMGLMAQPVMAQEPVMQRVEITGSAIKRIDAETSVPVTVIKMDDLKKQGVTTIEQVLGNLAVSQASAGTSQVVGSSTGGASFADLRGIGSNKTLILLNGRRLANNAFDSSAPDLNMIPFAALERVEVLRDGASALYGSDAVGGVINFITKKDFTGGNVTVGADSPQHPGGKSKSANLAYGFGDLSKDGFNIFAVVDHQKQDPIKGTQRPFNTRYAGGLSPTTNPANYYQAGDSGNPTAPSCATGTNLIPAAPNAAGVVTGCQMTTSSFVDYIPKNERNSALIKGTMRLGDNHELSLEYLATQSKVGSQIAPVPYGGLKMNRTMADGSLNPFYPGNPGAITPNIPLDPLFAPTAAQAAAGIKPGFINVKWRDLPNGPRADHNKNDQQRFVALLTGAVAGWDYDAAFSYNKNKVKEGLTGYSDGSMITAGVLNGIINPFGDQTAAGTALLMSAALDGTIQTATGKTTGVDVHASREFGDWFGAGKKTALAIGAEARREEFVQAANTAYAEKVVSSTGLDPELHNEGKRNVYAAYAEFNMPVLSTLDLTAALRFDKYSDFGSSTNPKVSLRWQPSKQVLVRSSFSTGFRAPSLYEINSAQAYTNTSQYDDPVNCPGGTPIAGKPAAANCQQQFQALTGGNTNLEPEKSRNASLGIVFEPINNLTMNVDLWMVNLKHTIGSLSQDNIFADPITYASVFHRNPAGNLSTDGSECPDPATCGYVDQRTQNLGGIKTNGVDFGLIYKMRTASMGNLTMSLNSTFVNKYSYQNADGAAWNKNVGIFSGGGPIFKWQDTANLNWSMGPWGAGLTGHYKSGYSDQDDPSFHVASYSTFDAYGSFAMKKGFNITFGVRNLADREPPLTYQTQVFQAGYDPRYTDPTGRTYYVRAGYSF
jgi:iron complex outermembrane receptor protein